MKSFNFVIQYLVLLVSMMTTTKAFHVPYVPSQPILWLTNRVAPVRSHQKELILMAIDIRAIYGIDGMDEQKLDDLRKGGLPLTQGYA